MAHQTVYQAMLPIAVSFDDHMYKYMNCVQDEPFIQTGMLELKFHLIQVNST